MDSLQTLLLVTTFVRGLGSGMIAGILLLTMPVRSRVGMPAYASFILVMYQTWGVRVYAGLTGLGVLLTIWLLVMAIGAGSSSIEWIAASLAATTLGFVGTAGAYPTMRRLWTTANGALELAEPLMNRFERWGMFSAACHLAAFVCLVVANQ